jgi:formylmethanofuran dehydrogenase subunit E
VLDFGKVAATFVDSQTGQAVRIHPHPQARHVTNTFASQEPSRWHAYLAAYQVMPVEALLVAQPVRLVVSLEAIVSRPSAITICERCGEEILNEREIRLETQVLCRACAGGAYGGVYYETIDLPTRT